MGPFFLEPCPWDRLRSSRLLKEPLGACCCGERALEGLAMGALFSWGGSLLKVLREDELKEGRRMISYCRNFFLGGSTEANMKPSLAVIFLFSMA